MWTPAEIIIIALTSGALFSLPLLLFVWFCARIDDQREVDKIRKSTTFFPASY